MKSLGLSMEVAEAVGRLVGSRDPRHGAGVRFHLRDQADREGGRRGGGRSKRQSRGEVSLLRGPCRDRISPMVHSRLGYHSHGAGLSIAISASTSMRGRTTAY